MEKEMLYGYDDEIDISFDPYLNAISIENVYYNLNKYDDVYALIADIKSLDSCKTHDLRILTQ